LRVMVTNDDGIDAAGIGKLEEFLAGAGAEVIVVAPEEEMSASSHSVSLGKPIRISERGRDRYAVSGTPVDTVNIAINRLLKNRRPEVLVSGINRGANLGCDIHYSGTVGAAREGALLGIPSIAVSLETERPDPDFTTSAKVALEMTRLVHKHGLPPRTILNINLPDIPESEIKGLKITSQGIRRYENVVKKHEDENGEDCYILGGGVLGGEKIKDSDIIAVSEGFVSITPLRLDLTSDHVIEWIKEGPLK